MCQRATVFLICLLHVGACQVISGLDGIEATSSSGARDGGLDASQGGHGGTGTGGSGGSDEGGAGGAGGAAGQGGSGGVGGQSGSGGAGTGGSTGTGGSGPQGGSAGSGGSSGTAGQAGSAGSCASAVACAVAPSLGEVSGDEGSDTLQHSGWTDQWVSIRATETNQSAFEAAPMSLRLTLHSPSGGNFDLEAYVNDSSDVLECAVISASSAHGGDADDVVTLQWGESGALPNGSEDSRTVSVHVVSAGGSCNAQAQWSLVVQAHAHDPGVDAGEAGTCMPPVPGGVCDTVPQCGCAAGQACDLADPTGKTGCFTSNQVPRGQPCTYPGDCAPSLTCVNQACKLLCESTASCSSIAGSACYPIELTQLDGGVVAVPNAGFCSDQCDPRTTQGCGAGVGCAPLDGVGDMPGHFACTAAGTSTTTCSATVECAPGYACLGDDTCHRWCRSGTSTDCSGGEVCVQLSDPVSQVTGYYFLGSQGFGVCSN